MQRRVLGATAAGSLAGFLLSSEYVRSSRFYWLLTDKVVTPLLRSLPDPELAHNLSISCLKIGLGPVDPNRNVINSRLRTNVFSLDFSSPLGLAAGFDKQATCFEALIDMGFAFLEIGGVTPLPQPGNVKPRMFRLEEDLAVINRFGLNSDGAAVVSQRLSDRKGSNVVGVNLAKNSLSPNMQDDYCEGIVRFAPCSDFLVLNVSCPNVAYTKNIQSDEMNDLVKACIQQRNKENPHIPLLLKVSPDMNEDQLRKMARIAVENGVDGLVVSNTTSSRPAELTSAHKGEMGGLSGKPVKKLALETIKRLYALTDGSIPIVGVGGIASGEDAYERIRAGASLVEVYTALAYEGPGLVLRIKRELDMLLERDHFENVADCVGIDVPTASNAPPKRLVLIKDFTAQE